MTITDIRARGLKRITVKNALTGDEIHPDYRCACGFWAINADENPVFILEVVTQNLKTKYFDNRTGYKPVALMYDLAKKTVNTKEARGSLELYVDVLNSNTTAEPKQLSEIRFLDRKYRSYWELYLDPIFGEVVKVTLFHQGYYHTQTSIRVEFADGSWAAHLYDWTLDEPVYGYSVGAGDLEVIISDDKIVTFEEAIEIEMMLIEIGKKLVSSLKVDALLDYRIRTKDTK